MGCQLATLSRLAPTLLRHHFNSSGQHRTRLGTSMTADSGGLASDGGNSRQALRKKLLSHDGRMLHFYLVGCQPVAVMLSPEPLRLERASWRNGRTELAHDRLSRVICILTCR